MNSFRNFPSHFFRDSSKSSSWNTCKSFWNSFKFISFLIFVRFSLLNSSRSLFSIPYGNITGIVPFGTLCQKDEKVEISQDCHLEFPHEFLTFSNSFNNFLHEFLLSYLQFFLLDESQMEFLNKSYLKLGRICLRRSRKSSCSNPGQISGKTPKQFLEDS